MVVFWSRRRITLLQGCYNVVFLTSVFPPGINVAATLWFWFRFPDKNLNAFQYHYNFLFPKICNIALQFHFWIYKIYSVCVNANRSLKWCIFENLELVAEKRDFSSCVVHLSETAACFLAVNSVGSSFKNFLRSKNQNTGFNIYMLRWSYKTIWIHVNLIFT